MASGLVAVVGLWVLAGCGSPDPNTEQAKRFATAFRVDDGEPLGEVRGSQGVAHLDMLARVPVTETMIDAPPGFARDAAVGDYIAYYRLDTSEGFCDASFREGVERGMTSTEREDADVDGSIVRLAVVCDGFGRPRSINWQDNIGWVILWTVAGGFVCTVVLKSGRDFERRRRSRRELGDR